MKVVLLAGGFGTRISEESHLKPKPMIEIGDKPVIWHIMKLYSHYGFNDFIICLGYKGYVIKEYFANYFLHQSDITIDLGENSLKIHDTKSEPWKVTLVDTGLTAGTGGRMRKIARYLGDETFMMTYGDGVGDIDIVKLLKFHRERGRYATITSVQPSGRFGALSLDEKDDVVAFQEKPKGDNAWINGGFFVLEPQVIDYIDGDEILWEKQPLERLAAEGKLAAYRHYGFWKPMDTMRDKTELETLWTSGTPPWKVWK
jgi:glucose-1-phosphate cytidylyltransferase